MPSKLPSDKEKPSIVLEVAPDINLGYCNMKKIYNAERLKVLGVEFENIGEEQSGEPTGTMAN